MNLSHHEVARRNERVMADFVHAPDADALRFLIEASATPLLLLSRSGQVIYGNEAALALLGTGSGSLPGASLFDLLSMPPATEPLSGVPAVLTGSGGGQIPVRVSLRPGPDGTHYLAAALSDARPEEELTAAEALEAMGRLTTGISHDMKNVLQLVLGHGELLRRRLPPEPRLRAGIDQIIAAAERGARSSEAIQEYARLYQPPRQRTPLGDVVREAFALLAPRLAAGAQVRLGLDGPGPAVLVERRALRQAILYLGIRAAEAIPPDGVIEVSLVTEPGQRGVSRVALTIRDNGAVMPPDVIAQVRHPFDRSPSENASYIVGLAVADRILRDHGGSLELESRPGEGTVARLLLPVSAEHT